MTVVPTIPYSQFVQRLNPRALDPRQYRKSALSVANFDANSYAEHARTSGPVKGDSTTFLASQQYWGPDRDNRPSILFQLYPPVNGVTADPGLLFTPCPTTAFPELHVVVDDRDGQPLRNFPELPILISTKVEGWLLEAWMRLNLKLKHEDVMQRMPYLTVDAWAGRDNGGGFKNTLSARRRDFRQIGRCLSWEENSPRRSVFDRRLLEDVASNTEWLANQTTRYLDDLTLPEKKELIALNSRVRRGAKDGQETSGSGSSPQPPKRPVEEELEGHARQKILRMNDSALSLDDIDWPAIYANAERARQEAAVLGNASNITGMGAAEVDASSLLQNAMPPNAQEPVLQTGQALVDELAVRGVTLARHYNLPHASADPFDARYTLAQSSEDRRQLFLAVHSTLSSILNQHPLERFELDLSSYVALFNQLQDQYIHASFLEDRNLDLGQAQQMFQPLPAWAGAISEFDTIWVPFEEWENMEGREWNKVYSSPYVLYLDFEQKAEALGMLAGEDRALVHWPRKLVVTADFCLERRTWIVQMRDFEE